MKTFLLSQYVALLLLEQQAKNPFEEVAKFLSKDIVGGFTKIAAPIATLAFIGLGIAAMMSTDEHARQKFKTGLWWTGLAAVICFSASSIVDWLSDVEL